jgi:hypothetical protein
MTVISFGPSSLQLNCSHDALAHIRQDLNPFFMFSDSSSGGVSIAALTLHPVAAPDIIPNSPGVIVDVDTSLYKNLASAGRRWSVGNQTIVQIGLTNTILNFDSGTLTIDLWQTNEDAAHVDAVRTIKSLFTPALEKAGCVQLHSAGVVDEEGGILILGDMWQGKTTLLLEFLNSFSVSQLSCDTVVAWPTEEGITARGWPSPFSMSHGTMSDHPQLYPFFPTDQMRVPYALRWKERKKTVLTSPEVVDLFQSAIVPSVPRIHSVVVARFRPEEETQISKIDSQDQLVTHLQSVYLGSRDPIYHNWHQFVTCPDSEINSNIEGFAKALLRNSDVYQMTWAPSASSLLKQVPRFARLHKAMKNIVDY